MSDFKQAYYFSGFDPISKANIRLALRLKNDYNLKKVIFIPERYSEFDQYSHLTHRLNLIKMALAIHQNLDYYETNQRKLNFLKTVYRFQSHNYPALILLDFPIFKNHFNNQSLLKILSSSRLIIAVSNQKEFKQTKKIFQNLNFVNFLIWNDNDLNFVIDFKQIYSDHIKSNILSSSKKYIIDNWLYLKSSDFS